MIAVMRALGGESYAAALAAAVQDTEGIRDLLDEAAAAPGEIDRQIHLIMGGSYGAFETFKAMVDTLLNTIFAEGGAGAVIVQFFQRVSDGIAWIVDKPALGPADLDVPAAAGDHAAPGPRAQRSGIRAGTPGGHFRGGRRHGDLVQSRSAGLDDKDLVARQGHDGPSSGAAAALAGHGIAQSGDPRTPGNDFGLAPGAVGTGSRYRLGNGAAMGLERRDALRQPLGAWWGLLGRLGGLIGRIGGLGRWLGRLGGWFRNLRGGAAAVGSGFAAVGRWIGRFIGWLRGLGSWIASAVRWAGRLLRSLSWMGRVLSVVRVILMAVVAAVSAVATALGLPVIAVVAIIAAIVAAIAAIWIFPPPDLAGNHQSLEHVDRT